MRAKKSLGQNFLKSRHALKQIIAAAKLLPHEDALEVGPGKGVLTSELLASGAHVVAVEKDRELIPFLQEKFQHEISSGQLKLVEDDILVCDPFALHLSPLGYTLVANIPYYITGAFLKKFLSGNCQPRRMVLQLQKEVARRVVARDKKESILSLSVKAYGVPRYIETVEAKYFSPQPKVDSAIIAIESISKKRFADGNEEKFFEIIKAGFSHKRKKLIRNLETLFDGEKIGAVFTKLEISENSRAEDISLESWFELSKLLTR